MRIKMGVLAGLLALVLVAVGGCSNPFASCTEERYVVEEMWVGWTAGLSSHESFEGQGWTCSDEGSIRNAFGSAIGERYVCTICRED